MREDRQAGRSRCRLSNVACARATPDVHVLLLLLSVGPPPGVPAFIVASELIRLVGQEAHPTSPLVLARQSPRSVPAPLPVSHPLGSIDTESLCERNTESIYAVVN